MSEGASSRRASDALPAGEERGQAGAPRGPRPSHFAALTAAYVLAAWASRFVSPVEPQPGPWLGPGVAIAGLVLGGLRLWPAILVASFVANVTKGVPMGVAAGAAAGNALSAVVAVVVLQRILGFHGRLDRMWDVGALAVAAAASGILGAVIRLGVFTLGAFPPPFAEGALTTWTLGRTVGILVVAPFLLAWSALPLPRPARALECALLVALTVVVGEYVFTTPATHLHLLLPFAIWAAVRLGMRGATAATLAVYVTATRHATAAGGPFVLQPILTPLLDSQVFIAAFSLVSLLLAKAIQERSEAMSIARATERVARALRAARDAYRDLTEGAPDFIWAIDLTGRVTFISEAGARTLGHGAGELIGRSALDFLTDHPANQDVRARLARQAAGEEQPPVVSQWRTTAGPRWLEIASRVVRAQDGTPIGVRGISRDVDDRLKLEEALQRSEERYRGLVESWHDPVLRCDPAGRLIFANAACQRTLGLHRDGEIGMLHGSLHPEDRAQFRDAFERVTRGRHPTALMARCSTPDGWRWLEWQLILIRTPRGRSEIQAVGRDVTERRQLEEALLRSQRLASVGTLAAGIAHEIANPVSGVLMNAELALASLDDAACRDGVRASLQSVVAEAQLCGRILKGVLQFAREEKADKWAVDLNETARRTAELTRAFVEEHRCHLVLELAADLPLVLMNPTQMEQVLVNLVRNAVQAGGEGTTVWLRTRATAEAAIVVVRDDGPGIPEPLQSRIFDPFFTTRNDGTGLGLSVCHGIVAEHGGTIGIASTTGAGTSLIVEIPRTRDPATSPPVAEEHPQP